jgi:hypothetical protein
MTTLEEHDIDQNISRIQTLDVSGLAFLIDSLANHLSDCSDMSLGEEDTAAGVQKVVPCLLRIFAQISKRLAELEDSLSWSDRRELTPLINNLTAQFEAVAARSTAFIGALKAFETMDPSSSSVN